MKIFRLLLPVLITAGILLSFSSCKKGDGDPFFSIYSRKARLAGEWKVVSINKNVQYKTTTIETTFDGNKRKEKITVRDTIIMGKDSTLIMQETATGYNNYDFKKDGTYQMYETFTDDTNHISYTLSVDGLWYFLGANSGSGYKNKEVLGMQDRNYVFNPSSFYVSYTTKYKGDNEMAIYPIYELKSDEVIFKVTNTETRNTLLITTTMEIKLQPR